MAKISIIVPIYNAEKYLKQCLDSIINQTLTDIEIILINDGSSDDSEIICKTYLNDNRVSYYFKENEGLAAARADGISKATGEYIGFVDSDDWLEADMYEKMYNAAKSNDSDIVFCNCQENENGYIFTPEMPDGPYNRTQILNDILTKTLAYIDKKGGKRAIRWSNCLRIYKRETLEKNNIVFDRRLRRSQDLQLTYEATLVAQNYYYISEPLYHNRVVADSLSRGYTKNMWQLYKYLIDVLWKDTNNFKEADLTNQMHLRTFFFVTDCIENEMKPLCPNSKKERVRIISDIINDPLSNNFADKIPIGELSPLYQKYYYFIINKKATSFIPYTNKYQKINSAKYKHIRPIINKLTETKVYKKIRKNI